MLDLVPLETTGAHGWTRALLVLGTGTLTAAWLSIWVALLTTVSGTAILLPGPAQEALVLCGAAAARGMLDGSLGDRTLRALFTAGALVMALGTVWLRFYHSWVPLDPRWLAHAATVSRVGPALATLLTVLVLWWAGGRIGASPLDDFAVFRFFATGIAGLFGGLLLAGPAASRTAPLSLLGAATVVFFTAAFFSLPAAQLETVRARGKAHGTRLPPLDRRWMGTAGIATLGILLLAVILSLTTSGTLLTLAGDLLGGLPDLLVTILFPIIFVLGYLAQFLIDAIRHLLGPPRSTPSVVSRVAKPPRLPHQPHLAHAPLLVQGILGGVLVIAALAIAVALLSRAIGRLSGLRQEAAFEEERDSVWSWEEAGTGWQHVLGRLRDRLRRTHRAEQAAGPPRSVREAYRRLLHLGAVLGHARAAPETPQEYLSHLHALPIPDERDATLLTASYMRVRYGDHEASPEEVEQAALAWNRLDQAVRLEAADPGSAGPKEAAHHRRRTQ